jgi:protein-disulfide isomerase
LLVGLGSSAYSIYLAVVSLFVLEKVCIWCMALYATNFLILAVAAVAVRRLGGVRAVLAHDFRWVVSWPARTAGFLAVFVLAGVVLLATASAWKPEHAVIEPPLDECGEEHHTSEGHPLLGEIEARVTIEEFSDYECGFCRRAHFTVRKLVERYDGRVRFIHRHFPLDQACNPIVTRPFHRHACEAARAAICADRQGRFWEYQDLLFANQRHLEREYLFVYARRADLDMDAFRKCLDARETKSYLERDIREGIGWRIRGTPTFIVNGVVYKGAMSEDKFQSVIETALARCESEPVLTPAADGDVGTGTPDTAAPPR